MVIFLFFHKCCAYHVLPCISYSGCQHCGKNHLPTLLFVCLRSGEGERWILKEGKRKKKVQSTRKFDRLRKICAALFPGILQYCVRFCGRLYSEKDRGNVTMFERMHFIHPFVELHLAIIIHCRKRATYGQWPHWKVYDQILFFREGEKNF